MDTDEGWILIGLFALALLVTAFAAAAETVLTSISRLRAKAMLEEGTSKGRSFDVFMREPATRITAIVLLNTFAVISAATLATLFVQRQRSDPAAEFGAVLFSFALILVFQVVPKRIAANDPERLATYLARPVRLVSFLLTPLTMPIRSFMRADETKPDSPLVTEDEFRMLVSAGEDAGLIEEDEREMIRGVFDLEDTMVREIMVPRIDIAAVNADADIADVLKVIVEQGYSRIPVYEANIDNIIGIVYAKDLFQFLLPMARQLTSKSSNMVVNVPPLREILRPPYFIPESKRVDTLLRELQRVKVHIAIIIDEYGGTAGLVTIEDLLEEIVGEIQDEYDHENAPIDRLADDAISVNGKVSLADVNEALNVNLATDEYDSISGVVLERLGKVPTAGQRLEVSDSDGVSLEFVVLDTDGRRIKRLKVTRLPQPNPAAPEAPQPNRNGSQGEREHG